MAPRPGRPLGLWLLIACALAASAMFVGWRLLGPSDGALIPFYSDAWTAEGVRIDRLDDTTGQLSQGDLVLVIEGRTVSEWLDRALLAGIDGHAQDESGSIVYRVERDAVQLDVPVDFAPRNLLPYLLDNWGNALFAIVVLGMGLFVLWRRPELPAARALAIAATAAGGSTLPWMLGLHVSDVYFGWPFVLYALTVSSLYMLLWPAGALHLPLALMPGAWKGRALPRAVLGAVYGIPLAAYVLLLLATRLSSPSSSAWMATWATLQGLVIVPTVAVGLTLAFVAYRRAGAEARRQLRWALVGAGMATVVGMALMFVPELVIGRPLLPWSVVGLLALPLPIGLGVAIVRHRLFDIEVVVNRTLVYGGVTLAILATYVAAVTLLGTLLGVGEGFGVSLLATGAAALIALPARDLLQRGVNRLMYGDRDDPYRALVRLGQRLEGTLDPTEGPQVVVRTVADSLRVPWVGLRIGPAGDGGRFFEHGRRPDGEPLDVPLLFGAEEVGRLLVARRSPTESLSAADRRLLDALVRQAGPAMHALSLTFELVDSRQRIITAREEERRRIRRDLHDGLGPTLAAIGMRAEIAADLAGRDPEQAQRTLDELRAEATGALAEIRRLVDALRPPALDELGLVGALRQQADKLAGNMTLDVRGHELPELPAAIEVAAYRICLEAMTNAVRHSQGSRCELEIAVQDDGLSAGLLVLVSDDGAGVSAGHRPGIGLRSMRERAAEVGGTLQITPLSGGGTRVEARLPLGASP